VPLGGCYPSTNARDVAFVLLDKTEGSRYFYGRDLSAALQEMVAKGLFVTLVLGCCFSGRTVRHCNPDGAGMRSVGYDPAIDAAYPQESARVPAIGTPLVVLAMRVCYQGGWLTLAATRFSRLAALVRKPEGSRREAKRMAHFRSFSFAHLVAWHKLMKSSPTKTCMTICAANSTRLAPPRTPCAMGMGSLPFLDSPCQNWGGLYPGLRGSW
jgi:hypothetical protein